MRDMQLSAYLNIKNLPEDIGRLYRKDYRNKYIVARRVEDASLWYYGTYDTLDRAIEVAKEIQNGIVLRVM